MVVLILPTPFFPLKKNQMCNNALGASELGLWGPIAPVPFSKWNGLFHVVHSKRKQYAKSLTETPASSSASWRTLHSNYAVNCPDWHAVVFRSEMHLLATVRMLAGDNVLSILSFCLGSGAVTTLLHPFLPCHWPKSHSRPRRQTSSYLSLINSTRPRCKLLLAPSRLYSHWRHSSPLRSQHLCSTDWNLYN